MFQGRLEVEESGGIVCTGIKEGGREEKVGERRGSSKQVEQAVKVFLRLWERSNDDIKWTGALLSS